MHTCFLFTTTSCSIALGTFTTALRLAFLWLGHRGKGRQLEGNGLLDEVSTTNALVEYPCKIVYIQWIDDNDNWGHWQGRLGNISTRCGALGLSCWPWGCRVAKALCHVVSACVGSHNLRSDYEESERPSSIEGVETNSGALMCMKPPGRTLSLW